MNLSQLVNWLWRNKFGHILTAGTLVFSSMGCEGFKEQPDTYPPCITFDILRNYKNPELSIFVSDFSCKKSKVEVSKNLVRKNEWDTKRESYSHLDKIELYENNKLVDTFHPVNVVSEYYTVDILHKEGEFSYKIVAYDVAGNKAESGDINLIFESGHCFKKENLEQDEENPLVFIKYMFTGSEAVCADIEDKNSGIFQIRFYEDGRIIRTENFEDSGYIINSKFSCVENLKGSHTYQIEAEDFAGNKAKSEEREFEFL